MEKSFQLESSNNYCFIPDVETVFKLVRILERNVDGTLTVADLENASKQSRVKADTTTPVGSIEELEHPPADLIKLQYVNRPGILHTLRSRFMNDLIYTSIGQILVALNPFKWIKGIYDVEIKQKYKNRSYNLSDNPHIFAIAHDAFSDLNLGENQSMIISGESGAGKTEATKQCLNYLAFIAGSSSGIQEKILKASPILEAWGNAKTLRNNNSSRFGKYIEIWFDSSLTIVGSSNTTYILEKSRVVRQEENERNYHVFYQLLQGATPDYLYKLRLVKTPGQRPTLTSYNLINQSGCITIDDVDDAAEFNDANRAFLDIGFTQEEQDFLYQTIAGILHLGNITFVPNPDDAIVSPDTEESFANSAAMFAVTPEEFRQALLFRKITSGSKRRSVVLAPYNPASAADSRDALAKEIYRRCFDWIVYKINQLMYTQSVSASLMIGVLDIFGFEIFKKNSFEQLCINLANEALQQHFNYNIFQAEMNVYLSEDVPVPALDFKDNQDVLDLIIKRPKGLIPMLDEEGIIPKGSADGFLSKFAKQHSSNPRFKLKQKTNELGIVHYAGEVYYDVSLFLVKNKDTLSQDLIDVLTHSANSFMESIFNEVKVIEREANTFSFRADTSTTPEKSGGGERSKRATSVDMKLTVGKKFSSQLESLITNLNSTKPRYVRCIKPNQVKKPNIFVHDLTNEQLTYSGVFEAVIIMQNGYPFRLSLTEFRSFYHMLIPSIFYRKLIFQTALFESFCQIYQINFTNINEKIATIPLTEIEQFITKSEKSQSGVKKTGQKVKINTSNISREQSLFMVRVISLALPQIDYQKCFVGKTKVFYRAQEHRLLLESRMTILQKCLLIVQRQTRRYIARKLVKTILKEEQNAMEAIKSRNLLLLNQASDTMVVNAQRLQNCNRLTCSIKIVDICQGYTAALNQESSLQQKMTTIWNTSYANDPTKASQEEEIKFKQLAPLMQDATNISFEAMHKGIKLYLFWKENPILLQFEERVEMLGELVEMKRTFQAGIQEKNEFLLETAKEQYAQLKNSPIFVSKNCENLEKQAETIIENARKEYEELVAQLSKVVIEGKFSSKQVDPSTFKIDYTVDPLPLQAMIAQFENLYDFTAAAAAGKGGSGKKKAPVKVELLMRTCRQIHQLRKLVKATQWKECFQSIQANWNTAIERAKSTSMIDTSNTGGRRKSLHGTNEERMSALFSGKEIYLPKEIAADVLHELQQIIVASIYYIVIPRFNALLLQNTIPDIPFYYQSCSINNDELNRQFQEITVYEQYFDSHLYEFISIVREHVEIRKAASTGDKEIILQAIHGITKIPASHVDYQNLLRYQAMYEMIDELIEAIQFERWKGEKGTFHPNAMQTQRLEHATQAVQGLKVNGELWKQLLFIGQNILLLRLALQSKEYDEAEREIDILKQSSTWKAWQQQTETGVHSKSLPTEIRSLFENLQKELDSYVIEINHCRAFDILLTIFNEGSIPDNIEYSVPDTSISASAFEQIVHEQEEFLIQNEDTALFLSQTKVIVQLRHLLIQSKWDKIIEVLLPISETTAQFTRNCHSICQEEFQSIYLRYLDYQCRLQLVAAFAINEVPKPPKNDCELLSIILKFQQYPNLSPKTREMITFAKALVALRCSVRDGYWEPDSIFLLGRIPIDELPAAIVGSSEKESAPNVAIATAAREVRSIERTVHVFRTLESVISLPDIQKKIEVLDIQNLSVTETFFWFQAGREIPDSCRQEMEDIYRASTDRKCRILLLMAASTGKVLGTVEKLNYRSIKFDSLKGALAYAETNKSCWTETTQNWISVANKLLEIREVVYENCVQRVSDPTLPENIHQLLNNQEIQELVETTVAGFPLGEIKLVLNKVNDLNAFEELIQALTFGQPTFVNNKFDASRVQYSHLLERLEAAKGLAVRSDRLDRLFFYLELIINLRTAVAANQWDFSERGESRTMTLDRNVITVKKCLNEYSQAQKFFRTPVPGVPPQLLIDEFSLVSREWERRLTLQRFANAFKLGAVMGLPYALQFSQIKTDQLQTEITRVQVMEKESGEVDKDVQIFVQAANELITIRKEALKIQQSYVSPQPKFPKATNALTHVLGEESFIPDAISRAVNKIQSISTATSRNLTQEYEGINQLINNTQYCRKLPFRLSELDLLQNDISERLYVTEVLSYFQSMKELLYAKVIGAKDSGNSRTSGSSAGGKEVATSVFNNQMNQLVKALSSYQQRKAQILKEFSDKKLSKIFMGTNASSFSGGAGMSGANGKSSKVLEFIEYSAVLLVHIYRAKIYQLYDSFERDWKEDINFTNTPRLLALIQHLANGRYSFQQLIRSARRIEPFHLQIAQYLQLVEHEIEDSVSELELTKAFTEEHYVTVGFIGKLTVPPQAIAFAQEVVDRINITGYSNAVIKPMKQMLELLIQLRQYAQKNRAAEIVSLVSKYYKINEQDLPTLCALLYDSSATAQKIPIQMAQIEFLLIAKNASDFVWNEKMKILLIRDTIQGVRGSLYTFSIETVEGKQFLKIADVMKTEQSREASYLVRLANSVYHLRTMIQSISRESDSTVFARSASTSAITGNAIHNPLQGILWGTNVGLYVTEVMSSAVSKITQMGKVNWDWSSLNEATGQEMGILCHQILQLIDEEQASSGFFNNEKALKNVLTAESNMILSHLSFVQSGHLLEALLDKLFFKFTPHGLEIYYGKQIEDSFASTLEECEKQAYKAHLASEFYLSSLLKVTRALSKLCDKLCSLARKVTSNPSNSVSAASSASLSSLARTNSTTLAPGTFSIPLESEEFNQMIPAICDYLQLIADYDNNCQENGFKKRTFYTKNMTESLVALRACIHEHGVMAALLKIIVSEEVYLLEEDNTGHVSFHLRQIHGIFLIEKNKERFSYDEFAQQLIFYVDALNTITPTGKSLQDFTRQLIKFRMEIFCKNWFKAQLVYDRLASYPDYLALYATDLQVFQTYQQIIQAQRQLEYSLYQSSFPDVEFWTLHIGANTVLQNISAALDKVMRCYVDGSLPPLPKYKVFDELTEIAYLILELVDSWRIGIIISFNDFIDYSNHKLILPVTHHIGDEVILHYQSKESLFKTSDQASAGLGVGKISGGSSVGSSDGASVLAMIVSMEGMIGKCNCLSPSFRSYLENEVKKLELEVVAIQLEQVVKHAFDHIQFVGLAGELVIADCTEPLYSLCQTLEGNGTVLTNCLSLKQAWYSAKSVLGFIAAHYEGNIRRLSQWMDITRYLSSQSTGILQLKKLPDPSEFQIDMKKIQVMDEYEYQSIYSKPLNAYRSHLTPLSTFSSGDSTPAAGSEIPYYAKIQDSLSLDRNMKECLGVSLSENNQTTGDSQPAVKNTQLLQLRLELRPYLPLLHQHALFEQLYINYQTALHDRPATGAPGELDGINVKYAILEDILAQIKQNEFELRGYCLLLNDAAESLYLIRKGQKLANEQVIQEGISVAKDALSREQTYGGQSDVVYFGKKEKQFLVLAAKEVEVAEEDLKQRYLIRILKEGLTSPGIPSNDYPFNIRAIEVESLVDACNESTKIAPSCRLAQDLLSSAKIIVKVRKLIVQRNWKGVLEAIEGLYNKESNTFDIARNKDELFSAWKVAGVSEAVDLAYACYSTGKFAPSAPSPDAADKSSSVTVNASMINADAAKQAMEAFASLRSEWMNDKLEAHQLTCSILYQIRSYFLNGDYVALQSYTAKILLQLQQEEITIIPKCVEEINFAKEHSAYLIVTGTFKQALTTGMIEGQFGSLDIENLSIGELKRALRLSIQIVSTDREVERLQRTAKFIFTLRVAQMNNLWINFPLEEQLQGFTGEIILDTGIDFDLFEEDDEDDDFFADLAEEEETELDDHHLSESKDDVKTEEVAGVKEDSNQIERGESKMTAPKVDVLLEGDKVAAVSQIVEEKPEGEAVSPSNSATSPLNTTNSAFSSKSRRNSVTKVRKALTPKELYHQQRELKKYQQRKYRDLINSIYQHATDQTVEDILYQFDEEIREDQIDPTAFPEIELAYNEMRFRQILVRVISAIYTPGFTGIPGDINQSEVLTDVLENCLSFANDYPNVSNARVCFGFVRDAKLLLDARRCRLQGDYVQLQEIIQVAEEHNAMVFQNRSRHPAKADNTVDPSSSSASAAGADGGLEDVKPILSRVWEELMLLKYDSLFQIALHEFASEMKKEERLSLDKHRRDAARGIVNVRSSPFYPDDNSDDDSDFEEIDHNVRVYRIEAILDFTRNAALGYPSAELERLLEAIKLALKLRKFVRDEPSKSPQHIIDEIAQVKSRDRRKNVTCYVSLLIYEISKMSNVLDFPVLLETIMNEIEKGRQYLEKPIGSIDKNDINLEVFSAAYEEANSSLEIMGTDENRSFMKLAFVIMEMRKCIQIGDFSSAMMVVVQNEQYLQSDVVSDEIKRLRVEMENQDAEKLISYGLKTGRCLDVIAIAKMRSAYEMQNSFDPEVQYQVENILRNKGVGIENITTAAILAGEQTVFSSGRSSRHTIRRGSIGRGKVSSRRVSQGIADMMSLFQKMYLHGELSAPANSGDANSSISTEDTDEHDTLLPEVDKNLWQPAPQFIESVTNSIYSLKRAVNVASRVAVKAHNTDYYLQAAKIILQLRESIVYSQWNVVEEIVEQELDLPEVALEEVNAVREGLLYQKCLFTVCESLIKGMISGEVYNINFHLIEFLHLTEVLEAFEIGGFQDRSTLILMDFVKRVVEIRRNFLSWCYAESIIPEEMIQSNPNISKAITRLSAQDIADPAAVMQTSATAKEIARRTSTLGSSNVASTLNTNLGANKDIQLFRVLDEYEAFQERELTELKRSLGLLGSVGVTSRSRATSAATPLTTTASKDSIILSSASSGRGEEVVISEFEWINQILDTLSVIKEEVNLIKEVIEYRNLIHHMIAVLKVFPIPLLHYLQYQENSKTGNSISNKLLLTTFASNHSLRRREYTSSSSAASLFGSALTLNTAARNHYYIYQKNQLEANLRILSAEYPIGSTDFALYREILSRNDIYFVSLLELAIVELENYVDKVRHSTSEELIIILSVAKTILTMRKLLQSSYHESITTSADGTTVEETKNDQFMEEISVWINETTRLVEHNVIPHNFGLREIHIYLTVNQQLLSYHRDLTSLLRKLIPRVSLDSLDITVDFQIDELQLLLVKIEQFLSMHSKLIHYSFLQFIEKIYILIQIIQYFQEENYVALQHMFQSYNLKDILAMKSSSWVKAAATRMGSSHNHHHHHHHHPHHHPAAFSSSVAEPLNESQKQQLQLLLFAPECQELQDLFDYLLLGYSFYTFHQSLQERIQQFNRYGEFDVMEFPLLAHQKYMLRQDYELFHHVFEQFRMIQLFPLSFVLHYREEKPEAPPTSTVTEAKDGETPSKPMIVRETVRERLDLSELLEESPTEVQIPDSPLKNQRVSDLVESHSNIFAENEEDKVDSSFDEADNENTAGPSTLKQVFEIQGVDQRQQAPPSSNVSINYYQTKTFLIGKTLYKLLYNLCEVNRWYPITAEEIEEEEAHNRDKKNDHYVSSEEEDEGDDEERLLMSEDSSAVSIASPPLITNQCTHLLFNHYFDFDTSLPPAFSKVHAVAHRKAHSWVLSQQLHSLFVKEANSLFQFLHRKESIFHIIYSSFIFPYYPEHLHPFLQQVIFELINQHLTSDLTYYYLKGLPSIDRTMGNLILSELYLRFTNNILKDVKTILSFCQRHQITFALSKVNKVWFAWMERLVEIRNYLIAEPDIFKIKEFLQNHALFVHYLKYRQSKGITYGSSNTNEQQQQLVQSSSTAHSASKRPPSDHTSVKARILAYEDEEEEGKPKVLTIKSLLAAKQSQQQKQEEEINKKRAQIHPSLYMYTLLPADPQYHVIIKEIEAYYIYLVAIEDEILVMDCVKALYQLYQSHATFLNQAPSLLSSASQNLLFTKSVLRDAPFNQLLPMIEKFSMRTESSKFHEFIIYVGLLLYNLIYNLFLGSLNIVQGILEEIQTILYEENPSPSLIGGQARDGRTSSITSIASGEGGGLKTVNDIPFRINCPLVDYLKYYYSSIRKLILYMSDQIWPKFAEDHIIYQKFVVKKNSPRSIHSRSSTVTGAFSPPMSQQSPLNTISSFFASPEGENEKGNTNNNHDFSWNSSPSKGGANQWDDRTETSSPLFKHYNPQQQVLSSPYFDGRELKNRTAGTGGPFIVRRSSGVPNLPIAPNLSAGGQTVVMVPVFQSLIRQNYEFTLLIIHRICEIKDFMNERKILQPSSFDRYASSSTSAATGQLQVRSKLLDNITILKYQTFLTNKQSLLAFDRNLLTLIPKNNIEQLPYELYHRLLLLYLDLIASPYLIMNPQYTLVLLLILYYLRGEIIRTKEKEYNDKQKELFEAGKLTGQDRLLKRIEKFNHRFSLYTTSLLPKVTQTKPTRSKILSSFDVDPDDMMRLSGDSADEISANSEDEDEGFESEEEEDLAISEQLFGQSNRIIQQKPFSENRTGEPSSASSSSSLPAPQRPQPEAQHPPHSAEDAYNEYLRSNSSEELRKECFMINLSFNLFLLVQELPYFIEQYYSSEVYQLYEHANSPLTSHSFEFNPESHFPPSPRLSPLSPQQQKKKKEIRLRYSSDEDSELEETALRAEEEEKKKKQNKAKFSEGRKSKEAFQQLIYHYYYQTMQQTTSSFAIGGNGQLRKANNFHTALNRYKQEAASSPFDAQTTSGNDNSLDLNGFYPLHIDMIPNLISVFKHLYVIESKLRKEFATAEVNPIIQQYRIEYHHRRHSSYYQPPEKQRRRSSLRLSVAKNKSGSIVDSGKKGGGGSKSASITASRKGSNALDNSNNTEKSTKKRSIVAPRLSTTLNPANQQETKKDRENNAVRGADGRQSIIDAPQDHQAKYTEILKMTEDLQINNELWFIYQIQKMIEIVEEEQEIVLSEQENHERYHQNHYFYYNGLFQRSLALLTLCKGILPSLNDVYQKKYPIDEEARRAAASSKKSTIEGEDEQEEEAEADVDELRNRFRLGSTNTKTGARFTTSRNNNTKEAGNRPPLTRTNSSSNNNLSSPRPEGFLVRKGLFENISH